MTTTATRKSARKTAAGMDTRSADLDHEQLLLWTKRRLGALLVAKFQVTQSLNQKARELAPEWTRRIEDLIAKEGITGKQAALWRQVPEITFEDTQPVPAELLFGVNLCCEYRNGTRLVNPVLEHRADFTAKTFRITWDLILRDGLDDGEPFPEAPLKTTHDAVSTYDNHSHEVKFYGAVYPRSVTLGQAASDLASLSLGALIAYRSNNHGSALHYEPNLLFVTDQPSTYDFLVDQACGVLFNEHGDIERHDFTRCTAY
ncbi:hypothetical protein [Ottowia sp.]|uniref:hypothetical protein n=1 Tax=Ottowia sp. TaxID=1898956 RepID=UPI0025DC84D7|nr:hypothetical protein [Ottowia sp.]MBK6616238.1 hypothetical protein [Ottowia sp.]